MTERFDVTDNEKHHKKKREYDARVEGSTLVSHTTRQGLLTSDLRLAATSISLACNWSRSDQREISKLSVMKRRQGRLDIAMIIEPLTARGRYYTTNKH